MDKRQSYPHFLRRDAIVKGESTFSHPWNPKSEITGTHLSALTGLKRTGVSVVRLAPGKESFAYHLHHREEEWIYILSGTGIARVDGEDIADFPTLDKRMIRRGSTIEIYKLSSGRPFDDSDSS